MVYKKYSTFSNIEWRQDDIRKFTFQIKDTTYSHNIIIPVRYTYGYRNSDLRVKVIWEGPDGFSKVDEVSIPIRDSHGKFLGKGMGDIWDIEFPYKNGVTLKKGTYTLSLQHQMNRDPFPFVMEVGIVVKQNFED